MKKTFTLLVLACGVMGAKAQTASPLTPGNIIIYRVGTGDSVLTNRAYPVFLDERQLKFSATGHIDSDTLIQSIALPSTVAQSKTDTIVTASGTGVTEGQITRSTEGKYVVFGGYWDCADTSIVELATTSGTATKRVLGLIDANGVINTSTTLTTLFSGDALRAYVFDDSLTHLLLVEVGKA